MGRIESDFSYAPDIVKQEWGGIYDRLEGSHGDIKKEDWAHYVPLFVDTHSSEIEQEEIFRLIKQQQRIKLKEIIGQPEATVKIDSPLPITVFFIGDIHTGAVHTNEKLWQKHKQAILETDGAYVIFLHNLVDNHSPSHYPNGMLEAAIHPKDQFPYMQAQLKELDGAGKILAVIEDDCHEGWSYQECGISASDLLYGYQNRQFPVLENGGLLNLRLGKERYKIGLWHKQGPYHSNFNPEHALRQNRRLSGRLTDVEAGAHHHVSVATNDWEGYNYHRMKVAYIRVGTYEGYWPKAKPRLPDRYAVDRWGRSGEPPGQSVMFYPYQHEVEATLDFENSVRKHEAIRIALWLETIGEKQNLLGLIEQGVEV